MPRYLTPEWVAAMDAAAKAHPALREATRGAHLVVQHVIGRPRDGVAFHVVVDDGEVSFRWGRAEAPTITFTEDRSTATSVATGAQSAQAAFLAGRMCVEGDLAAAVRHAPALGAAGGLLSSGRADTDFG